MARRTAGNAGALPAAFALVAALPAGFALVAPAAVTGGPPASRKAASIGSVGTAGREQPERPDLVEAARRQRERVAGSRERRGPAPRVTDADLPRSDRSRSDGNQGDRHQGDRNGTDRRERPGAGAGEADSEETAGGDARNSGEEAETGSGEPAGAGAAAAEEDPSPEEREQRAAELREKLLDLEAALAALGVSGLPTAARHPNRFVSAFDAARLRAELREARRELAELESGTGARPR